VGSWKNFSLLVGIAVSGIGRPETDAPAMGEAVDPCLNPIRPPLPFRPSESKFRPGCEMDDVVGVIGDEC